MTMNNRADNQQIVIELEEGWTTMQKGITKLKNLLERISEQPFNSEEYLKLYTTVYTMCNQNHPHNYYHQLYDRYKDTLEEYINTMVLPVLIDKYGEWLLRQLTTRWYNYKLFVLWLSHFFQCLDRHCIMIGQRPTLHEINFTCFRDKVYVEIKNKVKNAVIAQIYKERIGGKIDLSILKHTVEIFVEIGMGAMDAYQRDFELPMLTETTAYYSREAASWIAEDSCSVYMLKVEECLEREKERVGHYLHASTKPKLLERVKHELLIQYEKQLLEKAHSGCHALFRYDKVEDISRMYRLFSMIPEGLRAFAALFRQHISEEGWAFFKQTRAAARISEDGKVGRQGGEEYVFVRKVTELHDKYSRYLRNCFFNHSYFQKALKESFEAFCKKDVTEGISAELLATFCDYLLKKGGSERLSDGDLESTLAKVVKILAYIRDKDLFAEFYRKKLSYRLLFDKCASDYYEIVMLAKLKEQCGGLFTSNMEAMLTDLTLARENQIVFREYLRDNAVSKPEIDLTVTVLNTSCWPSNKSSDFVMPAEMVKCVEVFKEYCAIAIEKRKLNWVYSLSTCKVIGRFDPKSIELIMTTYQAAVLLLFNTADTLSYAEIKGQLNLTDENIEGVLHSLSCAKYKILNKDPSTNSVTLTDSFKYNSKFTDKMSRITILYPPIMDEKKKVIEDVDRDRRYAVDASIMRIMKFRKLLLYQQLVSECVEQLRRTFKPDVELIKKRMEDLIDQEYLERDLDNFNMFRYLG